MKLFLSLVATFILFTIIGTLTHELGHYGAAKYLGLKPNLHYQSVDCELSSNDIELDKINGLYQKDIEAKRDFPARKRYEEIMKEENKNDFITRAWGPLQTMITGSIGFILLIVYRSCLFTSTALNIRQWLLIFFSLFWLRQVLNFFLAFVIMLTTGRKEFYGDEFVLALHLGLPNFTVQIITAIIGVIICCIVVFKFVPSSQRKIFIAAGFVGGVIGYILWMYILGPKLMP
jgi:cation transport ATPase